MSITTDVLNLKVLIRRVSTGATPFRWEVHREGVATPVHVSPGLFKGMEPAYQAGQIWLQDFIASSTPPKRQSRPQLSNQANALASRSGLPTNREFAETDDDEFLEDDGEEEQLSDEELDLVCSNC